MTVAPKILVADDDQALSRTLSWILKENGYDVFTAPGGEHLFEHLTAEQFDLLLLDIMMPKVDGLQLLQRVKADPRFKDLPVLMISSMPPEEATVRSLGLGAADFIPKPFRVRELLARVKAHLRVGRELNQARAEARSRSEMMDIMQEVTASLEAGGDLRHSGAAGGAGTQHRPVLDHHGGPGGRDRHRGGGVREPHAPQPAGGPQALPRDPACPRDRRDGAGAGCARPTRCTSGVRDEWEAEGRPVETRSAVALRFSLRQQPAGVFFLRTTSEDAPLNEHDVQFAEEVINAAVAALERAYDLENAVLGQEQMRHLAETDPLTNCFNRRALMEKLEQEMDRAARYATMLTGMMVDIDNFKQINDTYGHLVGDRVLKQLANLLKREQRSVDIVARYGGEEFVVLLPETTSAESRNFAERILRRVSTHDFGESGDAGRVTISIGIASYPDERVSDGESLLRLADTHLYRAKSDGRNRFRD